MAISVYLRIAIYAILGEDRSLVDSTRAESLAPSIGSLSFIVN